MLNYKSHCAFSLLNSLKADIFLNTAFMPCFSGGIFFKVQVFQGPGPGFKSSPKVDHRFKLFTFTSWYLWLQFFFFFKYQVKIFGFREVFLKHKLVTQKISYDEIIYHSRKRCSFFYIRRRMRVNFLNIWSILLVQTSFLSMLVENVGNLMVAKMFGIQLWLKKVFGDLRFSLLC